VSDDAELPDEEIVRRVRSGDGSAARSLFERHRPALRAKARARLPAALRAKIDESDVVQDAYLAAFLSLGEFEDRGDGSFAAWLKQILEHKIKDEVRHHAGTAKRDARREVRLPTTADHVAGRGASRTPSVEAMAAEESARLRAVVDSLPDDYATVVRLVHLEGRTLADAGALMGRSADAARMLYGRAMARLADRLGGGDGDGDGDGDGTNP
jgi:RNA polymerase sigma-70 factor, ECF subfamily